jgi:putative PIN family toxin of toxin-antitoxin system
MIVLIDTNVLISSALNGGGTPFKAFVKAVSSPNQGIICEQNIIEMRRIFNRKFPNKIQALESFLALSMLTLKVVTTPSEILETEELVRDENDRPILRAAINAYADIIVTGDKDLLEANIQHPLILTPTQFLEMQ